MRLGDGISLIKQTINNFFSDEVMTGAAALAFYSALSLAPLVLLFVSVAGMLGNNAQAAIVQQFGALVGPEGGRAISLIVSSADRDKATGSLASIVSLSVLIFSASAVFGQLQTVLNKIFRVQPKPGLGVMAWLISRLFSIGILFALGFVMLVSLIISSVLTMISPQGEGPLWNIVNVLASTTVFSLFFAVVYKQLPDVKIAWRDTWIGALLTASLFSFGKFLIGLYLGSSAIGSAYGAAGSLIVLLVWVYYSSILIFFGAELTKSILIKYGRGIQPDHYAHIK